MGGHADSRPALLFDLDGTLVDSVYQHVLALHDSLQSLGVEVPGWLVHRRIGMSGGLAVDALLREAGRRLNDRELAVLKERHFEMYASLSGTVRPLPGACELLRHLTALGIPWAIASSAEGRIAAIALNVLGIGAGVAIVTRDEVPFAKPDPHLFLAAAERLGADIENVIAVGDATWDILAARRARALGVGILAGGFGREDLERAGAYRVYADPSDLDAHLDELGIRYTMSAS